MVGIDPLVVDTVFLICALGILIHFVQSRRQLLPLPPGPRPWPLLGNIFDFPTCHEGRFYFKHKEMYGPISSLSSSAACYIIINDAKIASELLGNRSINTSDRFLPTFSGMVGTGLMTTLRSYGPTLKFHRKLIQSYVNTRVALNHIEELEEVEARRFLFRLLDDPENFFQHSRTFPGAVILKVTYGYTISPDGYDVLVHLAERALDEIMIKASVPGIWLVDRLPFLRHFPEWLPGMSFKRTAREWREVVVEYCDKPYNFVKKQMSTGKAKPSYTSHFLENGIGKDKDEEDSLKYSAATVIAGGADTSAAALKTFFRAMALHPKILLRAQEEIDTAVGQNRLPSFRDRDKLPYTNAIMKEVIRWETVTPNGIPHVATNEDTYAGYRIPKNAIIIPNVWGMSRDLAYYTNPSSFDPSRFMKENPEPDPYMFAFGFGRRVCPGKKLADSSLFISISMILATLNITKAKDEYGCIIEPDCTYQPGIVSHPTTFRCSITPRSALSVKLIRSILDEHPFEKGDSETISALGEGPPT